jgi:hypothetical protein
MDQVKHSQLLELVARDGLLHDGLGFFHAVVLQEDVEENS